MYYHDLKIWPGFFFAKTPDFLVNFLILLSCDKIQIGNLRYQGGCIFHLKPKMVENFFQTGADIVGFIILSPRSMKVFKFYLREEASYIFIA